MTGTSTVWHRGGASGLEKQQCTVQLTIFADGVPRVKPLLVFRGKGFRILQAERNAYDCKVVVKFQENTWCDQRMMEHWCQHMWKRLFRPDAHFPKLLIADVRKAQTIQNIQEKLRRETATSLVFVPRGCTSLVHLSTFLLVVTSRQSLNINKTSTCKIIVKSMSMAPSQLGNGKFSSQNGWEQFVPR